MPSNDIKFWLQHPITWTEKRKVNRRGPHNFMGDNLLKHGDDRKGEINPDHWDKWAAHQLQRILDC